MPAAASLRFDSAQNRERGARRFSSSQGDAADGGLHAEALGRLPRRRRRHVEPGGVTRPDAVVQPVRHRRGRRGFGRSYVDAFRRVLASDADLVCQMDADLSHGPSYLPALVAAAGTFDVVIGLPPPARRQRREPAAPPHRAQRGGQPLRAGDHGRAGRRLHERLPLQAAGGARPHPTRPPGLQRVRVPHRDTPRGAAPRRPDRRGADRVSSSAGTAATPAAASLRFDSAQNRGR